MRSAFVTGATGLVGSALVNALLADGVEVTALARGGEGAHRLSQAGVTVVRADLGQSAYWELAARDADVIFHLALPRIVPPVRSRQIRRLVKEATVGAEIVRDVAQGADVVMASCALATSAGPLDLARPALAAAAVLTGPATRVVSLPWAYGQQGFLCDMSRGLQMRRYRIVGPGTNRLSLIGAKDAAAALLAAASAPAGAYAVAEASAPTQTELVHHMCTVRGVPQPDHLPPGMASLSMGGAVVDAVTAEHVVTAAPPPGFVYAQRWDAHMMQALGGG